MGDLTTVSLEDDTRERLDEYRSEDHHNHHNWSAVLEDMMAVLPPLDKFSDGCVHCGTDPFEAVPADCPGGLFQWFNIEDGPSGTAYFCSVECAEAENRRWQNYIPEYPDLVVVGGHEEMRTEFTGATFYLDEEGTRQVGLSIPGAFGDAYVGEPVYLKNEGEWVQEGVIKEICHEEVHTTLDLGRDHTIEESYHPDDDRRERYLEGRVIHFDYPCPACETELHLNEGMDDEVECGECGEVFERPDIPADTPPL